jgi:hypothetical protein
MMLNPPDAHLAPPLTDRLGVLTTTLPVVLAAPQVTLHADRVATVASVWAAEPWPRDGWDTSVHFFDGTERTLNWMALLDALNFCFWPDPPKPRAIERRRGHERDAAAESGITPLADAAPRWRVRWRGTWYNGYNALAVALTRALDAGHPLWDAGYVERMDDATMRAILQPDPEADGTAVEIPLLEARVAHARELGRVLNAHYDGQFANVMEAAGRDAVTLALLVARDFASFNDVAEWGGTEVRLMKRAQILVSDISSAFGKASLGHVSRIEELTAFADYKVPQLLRRLGILTYAPDLAARLDRLDLIAPGEADEVAIRAATVWGVEWLRRALDDAGIAVTAPAIDYRLWLAGQQTLATDRPYHRTRTIYY